MIAALHSGTQASVHASARQGRRASAAPVSVVASTAPASLGTASGACPATVAASNLVASGLLVTSPVASGLLASGVTVASGAASGGPASRAAESGALAEASVVDAS